MGLSSKERDRLTSERKRLAVIWQTLAPEQQEMRKQSERLNTLTKELESLRDEVGALEEACKLAGYYTDSGSSGMRAMFENAMAREGVLVETCKVENLIKGALDITESLLGREKRKLHKVRDHVFLVVNHSRTSREVACSLPIANTLCYFVGAGTRSYGEILEPRRWSSQAKPHSLAGRDHVDRRGEQDR